MTNSSAKNSISSKRTSSFEKDFYRDPGIASDLTPNQYPFNTIRVSKNLVFRVLADYLISTSTDFSKEAEFRVGFPHDLSFSSAFVFPQLNSILPCAIHSITFPGRCKAPEMSYSALVAQVGGLPVNGGKHYLSKYQNLSY